MLHYIDVKDIRSAAACYAIAEDLERLAKAYIERAHAIENHRANAVAIDDKWPVMKAARLSLEAVNNGAQPATICQHYAQEFWVDFQPVYDHFQRLHRAQTRDKRKIRNEKMRAQRKNGAKIEVISRRFGVSISQTCKICNSV